MKLAADSPRFTVASLCREAGISKATFYQYFAAKNDLYKSLTDSGLDLTGQNKNRPEEIMNAALFVVAKKGLHAATMDDIAEEAGISKAAIYWHFKDKEQLFRQAIQNISPLLGMLPNLDSQLDRRPEELLPVIGKAYLSTFDNPNAVRLFRILLAEAPRIPDLADNFARNVRPALEFIVRYLQQQIDLGRLKRHDTSVGARIFIGSLMVYVLSREVLPPLFAGLPDAGEYVDKVVAQFLDGLRKGA